MNLKKFLTDAIGSALELGVAAPDDVLRHVTPDVLANYLPRPLWARLLTACLGASKIDAQLVVETIGVPNLCEHVPSTIMWSCLGDIAARSLGKQFEPIPAPIAKQGSQPSRVPLAPAPEPTRRPTPQPMQAVQGPAIPGVAPVVASTDDNVPRTTTQRFRQASTGIGRLGSQTRRPQAQATPTVATIPPAGTPTTSRNVVRRGATDLSDQETETAVESEWKDREIAVDDSQLVDWATEGTDDFSDIGRKR